MPGPSLRQLTALFLRVSNLTFGGGDPTMAVMQREAVHRRGWISADGYGLAFSLARVTPGTNVLAFTAAIGWMLLGARGAAASVAASTVPSAMIALLLMTLYQAAAANPVAASVIAAILAAAVGMMAAAAWLLMWPHLVPNVRLRPGALLHNRLRTLAIVLGSFALLASTSFAPVQVLGMAALVGFFWPEQ
ncbi:MAG: chromate transporter [Bryobacteraceae bacterium]